MVQVTLYFFIGNHGDSDDEQHSEEECQILMGQSREVSNDKMKDV